MLTASSENSSGSRFYVLGPCQRLSSLLVSLSVGRRAVFTDVAHNGRVSFFIGDKNNERQLSAVASCVLRGLQVKKYTVKTVLIYQFRNRRRQLGDFSDRATRKN